MRTHDRGDGQRERREKHAANIETAIDKCENVMDMTTKKSALVMLTAIERGVRRRMP